MLSRAYSDRGMGGSYWSVQPEILLILILIMAAGIVPAAGAADSGTLSWTQITNHAPFAERNGAGTAVFEGKIWLIGGGNSTEAWNDAWYSSDGEHWEQAPYPPFAPRYQFGMVVFDNRLWVIGGNWPGQVPYNDVWYTCDGQTWTEATDHAAFSPRYGPGAIVFDGKMWVIGGATKPYPNQNLWDVANDVWYSSDGITWTEATPNAAFPPRTDHATATFNGKIWVIDGWNGENILGDTWYSSDGINWQLNGINLFPARRDSQAVTFDGKLLVIGGFTGDQPSNDVWYTDDHNWMFSSGRWYTGDHTWIVSNGNSITPRGMFNAIVFNNRIWVLDGYNGSQSLNDIWSSSPAETAGIDAMYTGSPGNPDQSIILKKTVSPQEIKVGTNTQVTMMLTNSGPFPIHDIEIRDDIPAGFSLTDGQNQYRIPGLGSNDTRIMRYTIAATKAGRYVFNGTLAMYAGEDGNYRLIRSNTPDVIVLEPLIQGQNTDKSLDVGRVVSDFFRKLFP